MSKARRDTNSLRCSILWNGQANSPVQRERDALLAGRGFLAHHGGFQVARAFGREIVEAWRPSAACRCTTPTTCGITSPARWITTVSPIRMCALAQARADALDLVLIVQRDVLHDDAADPDRLELADRRERAGAADLDLDVAQHGGRALGGEFVRDRPARRARDEAEPLLPVEAVDLVDDAVDVVVEAWRAAARSRGGRRAASTPLRAGSADWS